MTKLMDADVESLALKIHKTLGPGFSERVYHNCMEVELRKHGVQYESERWLPIYYEGHTVGTLRADIVIENKVILEFKAVAKLNEAAETQARNYLALTGLREAVLINFGKSLECRRVVNVSESTSSSHTTEP
jgi:GxxExxY protein